MPETLDIVQLVEKNLLIQLDTKEQCKLVETIKTEFSTEEQNMFLSNFFCYLQHDATADFVIELDSIWKWLGFSRKDACKRVLEKYFKINLDYKILLLQDVEQVGDQHGGHNKEQIYMSVNTFKKLSLKAGTTKADHIHDYYIKLENVMFRLLQDERNILQNKLQLQELDARQQLHNMFLKSYDKRHVNYIGIIAGNKRKYGKTNDICDRIDAHKKTYGEDFIFIHVVECAYNTDLERRFGQHPEIDKRKFKFIDSIGDSHIETFELDENLQDKHVINILDSLKRDIIHEKEIKEAQVADKIDRLENAVLNIAQYIQQQQHKIEIDKADVPQQGNLAETIQILQTHVQHPQPEGALPEIPAAINNIREFYTYWQSVLRPHYGKYLNTHKEIQWVKLFPAKTFKTMGKRWHVMKEWIEYIEKLSPEKQELFLKICEEFGQTLKESQGNVIKRHFYGAVRSWTTYHTENAKKLKCLLINAGLDVVDVDRRQQAVSVIT